MTRESVPAPCQGACDVLNVTGGDAPQSGRVAHRLLTLAPSALPGSPTASVLDALGRRVASREILLDMFAPIMVLG